MKLHTCILVSVARQHLPNEREMYVEARFGGLEVTLGDEQGYILSADMTGMHCFIVNLNIFYTKKQSNAFTLEDRDGS